MMNNENRLVCAIYTRVSSQGQVEEGFSLEEQERLKEQIRIDKERVEDL